MIVSSCFQKETKKMLDYGIIGNCKTCALVSKKASIDWFCFPSFSSQSAFARILDRNLGGSFQIVPKKRFATTQRYMEGTNILVTFFSCEDGEFVVYDFFPRYRSLLPSKKTKVLRENRLIRMIKRIKGRPRIRIFFDPKLNYASGDDFLSYSENGIVVKNGSSELSLITNLDTDFLKEKQPFILDETKYFVLGDAGEFSIAKCFRLLHATRDYWRKWVASLVLPDANKEKMTRSALLLKLLTFSETGAIIAAATTSIPEEIGTERTWDYRFCWIRDASFTVDALKKIGRDHEAKKLMGFIFENTLAKKSRMQIMYGIYGESDLQEKALGHLCGYRGSRPVRIGNAAFSQKQNDIYGSIIDTLYLYYVFYEYEKKMPGKYWRFLNYLVKEISNEWDKPDNGIWEFRGQKQLFTYSLLMCWVGVDRAVKIVSHFGREKPSWVVLRDTIRRFILERCWSDNRNAFTMYPGNDSLDASVLLFSYHNFLDHDDPRLVSTVEMIAKELQSNGLMQRYRISDDFGRSRSAFTICTFWLIDALYSIGKVDEARKIYARVNGYANQLGLFSEDIDLITKKQVGNFPQAYTHVALINTSILLSEWNIKRKKVELAVKKVR